MLSESFFSSLLRHRAMVLGALVVVIVITGNGARQVGIDYGVEQFFLQWGPERETYEEFKQLFPREDTRVSLFWKDPRGPSVGLYHDMERVATWFESAGLEDVRWLGSAIVAQQERIAGEAGIAIRPLVPADVAADDTIVEALRRHRTDRLLNGVLWDTTQTVLLIHGYVRQEENTDPDRRRIDAALRDSIESLDVGEAELVLTGLPIARARAPELLESDISVLLSAAFVVFFLVLYWYFRKASHVILSLASVTPAYLCVLGVLGFMGKPISILTSFIPIVALVVGMSDAVHVLSHFHRYRRKHEDRRSAVAATFAALAGPCFYTSMTTAVGFASLAGTRVGIVVDFGLLTAAAILLTFVFSMTVFPVLLSVVPDRANDTRTLRRHWLTRAMDAVARRARHPSRRPIVAAALVGIVAVTFAAQLRVDTYLIDDTKESAPFMRDIQWIDEHGFGFFQVNVLLTQTGERPLHAPEALRWMEQLRDFAKREPLVTHVVGLPDFVLQLRQAVMGTAVDPLPGSLEEASQLLLMAQLQDPTFVQEVYRETAGVAQVTLFVRDEGSRVIGPFLERLRAHVAAHPFPLGTVEVTGTVTMIQRFTERLLESFGPSIVIAILVITAIMMHMLRSVRLGLIALLPNLFPLVVLLGATAALGYAIKPSTILVLSIAFGIAVDDTIHLLSRVVAYARAGQGMAAGFTEGLRDAGAVMVVTTTIVASGFALLTFSHFEVLFLIGLMTALSAVTALVADLFVLPSIVSVSESWARAATPHSTIAKGGLT